MITTPVAARGGEAKVDKPGSQGMKARDDAEQSMTIALQNNDTPAKQIRPQGPVFLFLFHRPLPAVDIALLGAGDGKLGLGDVLGDSGAGADGGVFAYRDRGH